MGPLSLHTLDKVALPRAIVLDSDGRPIDPSPAVSWTVEPPSVARLEDGKLAPISNGEGTVEASVGEVNASLRFVVSVPDRLEISGYTAGTPVSVGAVVRFVASVNAGEARVEGQTVQWATSDALVATVDDTGLFTGLAPGQVTITASSGALVGSLDITVAATDGDGVVDVEDRCRKPKVCASSTPAPRHALERFPDFYVPKRAAIDQAFKLSLRLTESAEADTIPMSAVGSEGAGTDIAIDDAHYSRHGGLALPLEPSEHGWSLTAVLSLDGIELLDPAQSNISTLQLPPSGTSSSVEWEVVARSSPEGGRARAEVSLYRGAQYLGRVFRDVTIGTAPAAEDRSTASTLQFLLDFAQVPVDLHILVRQNQPRHGLEAFSVISTTSRSVYQDERQPTNRAARASWLSGEYAALAAAGRGTGLETLSSAGADSSVLLRGLGLRLWDDYVPEQLRRAFWEVWDQRGGNVPLVEVFTDDPEFPWELVVPHRVAEGGAEEELEALGTITRLGRWHLSGNALLTARPPRHVTLREVRVIAPAYTGLRYLPGQVEDVRAAFSLFSARPSSPATTLAEVAALLAHPPQGILHFAGHGTVEPGPPPMFRIALEDGTLSPTEWRGSFRRNPSAPIVFFNACELGQVRSLTGVVEGWAPQVLEGGAAGYIGALWSVSDAGAARFATAFYGALHEDLVKFRRASLVEALRRARAGTTSDTDPTSMAYVFYGDPQAEFVSASVTR